MLKNIAYLFFLISIALLASCEKSINVDLPKAEDKIVVEGYIENGQRPYVIITKNSPYFGQIDSASLVKLIVLNALVTVSDGNTTVPLKLTIDINVFPPFVYTDLTNTFKGVPGKVYDLVIQLDGKTYNSRTSIPNLSALDSSWFEVEGNFDSLGFIWSHGTDPDTIGNCYRVYSKRLHKDNVFISTNPSISEDRFFNGLSFDFNYSRGSKYNSQLNDDNNVERGFYKKKDTIILKFCSIDRASYDFWNTAERQMGGNGNPFASPASVKSNIQGGGLGVWCGLGATFDTIIAK